MATASSNPSSSQLAPAATRKEVTDELRKGWITLAQHEQHFIDFACRTGWRAKLIAAEVNRLRKIGELVTAAIDVPVEVSPDNVEAALAAANGTPVHKVVLAMSKAPTSNSSAGEDEGAA